MPGANIRKRVVDLLRPRLSPSQSADEQQQAEEREEMKQNGGDVLLSHCFLAGLEGKSTRLPEVYFGKTGCDLPLLQLSPLDKRVIAAYTGPDGGLTTVDRVRRRQIAHMANVDDEMTLSTDGADTEDEEEERRNVKESVSCASLLGSCSSIIGPSKMNHINYQDEGIDWERLDEDNAFGASVSLYERNPLTGLNAGTPIADVWAVCARSNNSILALADGVNWGEAARLAARCAIRGAVDHLNKCIQHRKLNNTTEVFHELLAAFHAAHSLILQEGGSLTTLCVAFAAPVSGSDSWALCVCNVGDSLCFVHSPVYGVREVTLGSHDVEEMRDMRNAGGALGPVDGRNPQLHNLTCSETFVEPGDIIFITSDGISDNFDPVVGKFCVIKRKEEEMKEGQSQLPALSNRRISITTSGSASSTSSANAVAFHRTKTCAASVPCVDAAQRHQLMLLRMRDVISNGLLPPTEKNAATAMVDNTTPPASPRPLSAAKLCHLLVQFATQLSQAKRRTLENPELYKKEKLSKSEERARRRVVRERIAEMPGKLDHASVVAYKVGVSKEKRENNDRYGERIAREVSNTKVKAEGGMACDGAEEEDTSASYSLENFSRQTRAACQKTLHDTRGEVATVSLSIADAEDVVQQENKREEPAPEVKSPVFLDQRRAGSPYEHIPMSMCVNSNGTTTSSRGKHARGSSGRHTVAVDARWIKRLVTRKNSQENNRAALSARTSHTQERYEEEVSSRSFGQRLRSLLGSSSRNVPDTVHTSPGLPSSSPPTANQVGRAGPHSLPPARPFRATASTSRV